MKETRFDRSVSMLAWGYNEEQLMASFLDQAMALLEQSAVEWELVVVDDGSTDGTPSILKKYATREPRLKVITHPHNLGIGQAVIHAIQGASKEYLFWQTVDWSYDIKHLAIYLELLKSFEVVVGIRPTPIRLLGTIPVVRSLIRIHHRSDDLLRAMVSLTNYYLIKLLYGLDFNDFQNVHFYPTLLIQRLDKNSDSSFLSPEMLCHVYTQGVTFIEVPIPFLKRQAGVAKGIKPKWLWRSVRDILKNWLLWGWRQRGEVIRRRRNHRVVYRVSEPFHLEEEHIQLTAPLFKQFR